MPLSQMLALAAEAATGTAAGVATASWLPTPAPLASPAADGTMGQLLLNLVVLIGVLAVFAWGAMTFMKGRLGMPVGLKARGIRIEDRLPIDPQRALLVIGTGKRRFLVGMTNYTFSTIAELDADRDFQQALDREVG